MADVLIYTSAMCPYCVAAKNLLVKKGAAYTEIRVDLDRGKREEMMARAKRTSVPQIFIGETHVGGFDDMVALDRKGGLEPLLGGAA
ncbi:MAG: glutaredoxin 3 [Xanthomonadaceae bacterium]|nr:glutaredoxin 3 [Xanthomonadaceae bacterium]MDP2184956.1 glutaredoxin 3 [Xanthomonadales bacterium]MDZ4114446.1 glutaredoxin 3 [Xanthomonadaceae bacterium]MDZ4378611.1 glutaredoxin 3 [Xanthomonadaceae bacterium]